MPPVSSLNVQLFVEVALKLTLIPVVAGAVVANLVFVIINDGFEFKASWARVIAFPPSTPTTYSPNDNELIAGLPEMSSP
jgi:hypothetical protein